jgi:amino acid transporter/nucleotide-binding universal stress UspA family protein
MMGLGMMIGAGVFIGIGISINEAGPGGVILTFALNGLIALFTAMSFAELSSAIPRAGGAYNFARVAFGRGPSFISGWMEWFASSVAGALYAVVFATYTLKFFDALDLLNWVPFNIDYLERIVAVAIASLFIYVNYRGASETGKIGALFTLGQMIFVLSIAAVGIVVVLIDPQRIENFKPFLNPDGGWANLLVTMGFIYVAFEGFEVIAQAGDETVDPKRNIPKAMIYSVLIVTITYVLVSFATVVSVKGGTAGVGDEPWRWIGQAGKHGFGNAVARVLPGEFLGYFLVAIAVIFSSTSALNATIYSATRASFALGRDRMLPGAFASISKRKKTPWVALLVTGGIILFVIAALKVEDVASCASMMFLFLFLLVNLCVIKVRLNMGDELEYGFVTPLFPLLPIIAIIAQVFLAANIIHMSFYAWIVAPLWVLAGVGIYLLYSRSRAVTTEEEIFVFEKAEAPPGEGYRIMVALANPRNALEMVRTTYRLCEAKNARVELLSMVPVPPQVPLADAERYMLPGREGIMETMLYLAPEFPTSKHIRYCRNIARGIISAVREKKIDMLIMGWRGERRARYFALGSTVDPVVERTPCDVVILKDCGGNRRFKRILVPLAGGPNGALGLEVGSILADPEEGELVAFTVDATRNFDIDAFVHAHEARLPLPADRVRTKVVSARNVSRTILQEARKDEYDLVVLGSTGAGRLHRMTRELIPETIAEQLDKPFVMVKASRVIESWIKRWV